MKKFKRITALIGVFLLISLYIITLLSAFTASEHSNALFMACLYSSIIIPIFIYAVTLVANVIRKKNEVEDLKSQIKAKEELNESHNIMKDDEEINENDEEINENDEINDEINEINEK